MLAVIVVCMCVVITVDCDGDIEEHFRRSLGRDYCNYLSHSSGDCTVRQSSAQWNGAVACSSAAAAPCSSAVTSSGSAVSRTTLSDLLSTDAEICDSTCDASKKCSAISITGLCVCVCARARGRVPFRYLRTAYRKQFYPNQWHRYKAETLKVCLLLVWRVCDQAFGRYRP